MLLRQYRIIQVCGIALIKTFVSALPWKSFGLFHGFWLFVPFPVARIVSIYNRLTLEVTAIHDIIVLYHY